MRCSSFSVIHRSVGSAGPRIAQQAVLFVIVTTSFYGMTDEGHHRDASWLDRGADTVGATVGALASSRMIEGVKNRIS
jgi:hypothetical protein